MTAEEDQRCWECEQDYKKDLKKLETLIADLKKQLLSEKDKCQWFYDKGVKSYTHNHFEYEWQIWISSMPADIEKRRSQKK